MILSGRSPDPGGAVGIATARTRRPARDTSPVFRRELVGQLLRCYPVSAVVLAPYLGLILPMAVIYHNPHTGLIASLVGFALLGSATVETFSLLLGRPDPQWRAGVQHSHARYPRLYPIARFVALTGIAADLLGVHLGRGTIVAQLSGELAGGPVATLTTLFSGWGALAVGLLIASHLSGRLSRAKLYGWLTALVATQTVVAVQTALTAALIAFIFFVAVAGMLCGIFRLRYLLVAGAVLILLWPPLFDHRNTIRESHGITVDDNVSALDRIRLDRQLATVAGYDVPVDLGQPGPADYLRYGLVPRMLDPDRPPMSTGQLISMYRGGSGTTAYSFLLLGNIWFFEGAVGLVVLHAAAAGFTAALLRWRGAPGPARLVLFCLALSDLLLWTGTYPDSVIGFLQHVVSAVPVFLLLWLTRSRPDRPGRHSLPGWRLRPSRWHDLPSQHGLPGRHRLVGGPAPTGADR
ncbi:hypothetical protein EDC02_6103 [Micromonospora sp. Llam0]|uniref:hypothetical protein n=1 Tax=Micromonospora sp. Llam0 TaxID=2485143 RepID=UPI000F48C56F|nr:hypothetical protein [Micromonospora sp. Llam0]ROO51234.1 hypothetical protein EDC02_6103 [Micromonospora sp. Llam0]